MTHKTKHGIGIYAVVFVFLLILKVFGIGAVACWSWWFVFAPLWAPMAVIAVFGYIAFIVFVVKEVFRRR